MMPHGIASGQRQMLHQQHVKSQQACNRLPSLSAGLSSSGGSNSSVHSNHCCHHHLVPSSIRHSSFPVHLQQQQRYAWPLQQPAQAATMVHTHAQPQKTQRPGPCRRLAGAAVAAAAAAAEASQPDSSNSSQQQQQHGLDLPPLELPPSRSTALWLEELSEAELQQAAADWGYTQVGRPLPEGLSLTALAETLPDPVFTLNLSKALGYLGLSLGVMALGYSYLWYWHSICPLWQQMLAWVVIGTGYFGVFQTAVDCAHFAFWPQRPLLQDLLGAVLMAPALISYEVFRLKYFNHLMCTNQLYEDLDAWHPLLPSDLAAMPAWQRTLTALLMATPLKFFASVGQWFSSLEAFDLRLHPKQNRFWVWLSWLLPLAFVGVVWPSLIAAGGVGGLVTYWLGPWLVFHCWTSVLSLIQHTGPHITWAEEGLTYDQAQATVNGTVNLQLPEWLEVLLHHANHHLPSHVSISIPSYNLKAAQAYLQQRLGKYLTTATLNANLLRNLMTAWLVYDEQRQRYVDFDEAEQLMEQYKQQQQQQQQQLERQHEVQQQQHQLEQQRQQEQQGESQTAAASIPISTLLGLPVGDNGASHSSSSSSGAVRQQQQQQRLEGSSSSPAMYGA